MKKSPTPMLPIKSNHPFKKHHAAKPLPPKRVFPKKKKAAPLSPEEQKRINDENDAMIREFIQSGKMQKVEPRWAEGSVQLVMFKEMSV